MRINCLIAFALLFVCPLAKGQTIADPVAYYLSTYGHEKGDKLLEVRVAFGRDSKKIVMLALTSSGERAGYLWTGFMPVQGGYIRLPVIEVNGRNNEGAIIFDPDIFYQGPIPEQKISGLISYAPDGGSGTLVATTLQDGALKQVALKRIDSQGADAALYKSLFQSHANHLQVKKITIPSGK